MEEVLKIGDKVVHYQLPKRNGEVWLWEIVAIKENGLVQLQSVDESVTHNTFWCKPSQVKKH